MELREKISLSICGSLPDGVHPAWADRVSKAAADAILDIPEIKEALASRRFITVDEVRAQMTAPPNA